MILIAGFAREHIKVIAKLPKLIPYHFLIGTLMLYLPHNNIAISNHMYMHLHTVYMKIFAGERKKFCQAQLYMYLILQKKFVGKKIFTNAVVY